MRHWRWPVPSANRPWRPDRTLKMSTELPDFLIDPLLHTALAEDLGRAGDITSMSVVPAGTQMQAALVARRAGVISGLGVARRTFQLMSPDIVFSAKVAEGAPVAPGTVLATIAGDARAMLAAERVALNLSCHLSGIATATAELVEIAARHGAARIVCTRKTTPGLRALEKQAVRAGGGSNHRFGLDDAILIKDNHIAVAGGVSAALARARAAAGHLVKIEIEVDRLDQLEEALAGGADIVLLDNMGPDLLREAVRMAKGRALTEASGGVTRETVGAIAASGVDLISVGWITHSAPILDIGLDVTG